MSDPIIDEIHNVRVSLWESCGQNWKALLDYFSDKSAQHPEYMVTQAGLERERKADSSSDEKIAVK